MTFSEESWIVIALNVIGLVIWGARLETRVRQLETEVKQQTKRIIEIDEGGTRGMLVLVERERAMTNIIEKLERKIETMERMIEERLDTIAKYVLQLKVSVEKNGK